MLRSLFTILFLTSCSLGTIKTGGEGAYTYDVRRDYGIDGLKELSSQVVETQHRDPPVGTLEKLFIGQKPIKRIGIIVFESQIQATRGGLASEDQVFLSAQGKQLLTEKMLTIWEESFPIVSPDIKLVPVKMLKRSKLYKNFGMNQEDHIKVKRQKLAPDDIFYLDSGSKTTTTTLVNPRGMRDMSLMLVPASELMAGPKWSEQHKHFVNDVMKELKLDAVLVVMSDVSWSKARIDKHSGEAIAENIKLDLTVTTLTSLSDYRARAEKIGLSEPPSVNLCFRFQQAEINIPAKISVEKEQRHFKTIEQEILSPMMKAYSDLSIMMVHQIGEELRKTF